MSLLSTLKLESIKNYYDSLDNKKRLVALISSLFIIFLLWYFLFMMPLQSKSSKVNQEMFDQLGSQIKTVQSSVIKLVQAHELPNLSNQSKEATFYHQLLTQYQNNELPTNIDNVMKMLLKNKSGLKLNGFKNTKIQYTTAIDSQQVPFEMYTIHLTFEGTFIHLASFLKRFENPVYPLYFQKLTYRIRKYPNGQLNMDIVTIIAKPKVEKP